jgi:hypothetical protein
MSKDAFVHFYDFLSAEDFNAISHNLFENGIRFQTFKTGSTGPEYMRMQSGLHEVELWIHRDDIKLAESVLGIGAVPSDEDGPGEKSTSELMEFIREPLLLEKEECENIIAELRKRGETMSEEDIQRLFAEHRSTLEKGVPAKKGLLAMGYLTAFGGGYLGLIIGFRLMYLTDQYPQGEEFPHYNESGRKAGLVMTVISTITILLGFAFYFLLYKKGK